MVILAGPHSLPEPTRFKFFFKRVLLLVIFPPAIPTVRAPPGDYLIAVHNCTVTPLGSRKEALPWKNQKW